MDYNLKTKSPVVAPIRNLTPVSSPRVGGVSIIKPIAAPANSNANTTAKKTSSEADIRDKLVGYVQVDKSQWSRLPVGSHIRYFANGDGSRASRFRTGGFIVSWTKSANGKVYLKIANKLEFTNKQAGYRDFSVETGNISEIWAKPEVIEKVKNEVTPTEQIKILADEVANLKLRIAALERRK